MLRTLQVASRVRTTGLVVAAALIAAASPAGLRGQTIDDLHLPEVKSEPWRFKAFPIIAWWAPPGTAKLEDFVAYREAGFNLHPTNPDAGFDQAMAHVRAAGLKSMPFRTKQGFALPAPASPVDYGKYDDVVVGWLTHDEPHGLPAVTASITAVNELMRQDPSRWALFNFLPPFAQGEPNTEQSVAAAVRNGLPILSYDHYYIHKDGTDDVAKQCAYLDQFRQLSLRHGKPFWAFALTTGHFHYRRPSESDVRWMQFTNLAYGAKGLWYFTYWGPADWENWDGRSIVDPKDGAKTELYEHVKAINQTVLAVGDVLLELTNEDVFHVGVVPDGQRALPTDQWWIRDAKAKDAIISFFKDDRDGRYAWVVNKLHGKDKSAEETSDTIELTFDAAVTAVTALSWLDGSPGPLKIDNGKAVLTVAGGTGVLLKVE